MTSPGSTKSQCFPTKQKQPADRYAKRQELGTHTPDDQVRAGMYKSGHTIDPVREELICLQGVDNFQCLNKNPKQKYTLSQSMKASLQSK